MKCHFIFKIRANLSFLWRFLNSADGNTCKLTIFKPEAFSLLPSVINKEIEFWNLVDACDPDIVIGTESWLTEEIGSSEIFIPITRSLEGIEIVEGAESLFASKRT